MNQSRLARVVSLVYEVTEEDGSISTYHLEDDDRFKLGYIRFLHAPEDPRQRFYLATDHDGLNTGAAAIGTSPNKDIPIDPAVVKDRTNQLIGHIRDGTCAVIATYDIPGLSLLKSGE